MLSNKDNQMKIITNTKSENHYTIVTDNLSNYDEVYIAVAFLKISGLKILINSITDLLINNGKITISI